MILATSVLALTLMSNVQHVPGRFDAVSSTGCRFPPDIDPNRLSAQAPPAARQLLAHSFVDIAEATFQQRLALCAQQHGDRVPGGCASACYGEPRPKRGEPR